MVMPPTPNDRHSLALFTAYYELTMAQAYWQSGQTASATFSLFIRRQPSNRGYLVFAGLDGILDFLDGFHYSAEDIQYLKSLQAFDPAFLEFLRSVRFTGSVRALDEGAIFFANEPAIEVTAPIIEAQVVENYLLNQVNLNTMLATKASRVVRAAQGRPVTEFASRRTPGLDAADTLARVSFMVGFSGTGNVYAAAHHGIPPGGTMAHSFVTSFEQEIEAFRAYARSFPDSSVFLVDSYDTIEGTRNAIRVASEMRDRGSELAAIRLDSGELRDLSRRCRSLLDEAGFPGVRILASGDLDEFQIETLIADGVPIDGFGVGTKIGTSEDAPWTDVVYKLVEYRGAPILKLSPGKETLVGRKQIFRFLDGVGEYSRDEIGLEDESTMGEHVQPLLTTVMTDGNRAWSSRSIQQLRSEFSNRFDHLPDRYKSLRAPAPYPVTTSDTLGTLQERIAEQVKESTLGGKP